MFVWIGIVLSVMLFWACGSEEAPDEGPNCQVTDRADGTRLIECDDGTRAVVTGEGDGGATCRTVVVDGGETLVCDDGTDGAACTVTEQEDGSLLVDCADGTSTLFEADCKLETRRYDKTYEVSGVYCPDGRAKLVWVRRLPPAPRTQLSAGRSHTCGLHQDGRVECWGLDESGQVTVPGAERFAQVTSGGDHTCGLRQDGTGVCWGRKAEGQLDVPKDNEFYQLSAGASHTCGLRSDGTALCWGDNQFGQRKVPKDDKFAALSAGGDFTCGLRADGTGTCWGTNTFGQTNFPKDQSFVQISAGGFHACGLTVEGKALCWGQDDEGQLNVSSEETFVQIKAGWRHTCGLKADGSARCWGLNEDGQAPGEVSGPFAELATYGFHTCGRREDGSTLCWGNNDDGQTVAPPGFRCLEPVGETLPGTGEGLTYWWSEVDATSRIPPMATEDMKNTGTLNSVALPPGVPDEYFAVLLQGYFQVTKEGAGYFALASDDGSRLIVNDVMVIDHDGLHAASPARDGFVCLGVGWHKLRIEYFEGTGPDQSLELDYGNTPGGMGPIGSTSKLRHD